MFFSFIRSFNSSNTAGSSMVDGWVKFFPSAMKRIIFLNIFPDLVLGRRLAITALLK